MNSHDKRYGGYRGGVQGHGRHGDGFCAGAGFMDETDREVSSLTDRAFRSLCIGEEAVYNDSSPVERHKAFADDDAGDDLKASGRGMVPRGVAVTEVYGGTAMLQLSAADEAAAHHSNGVVDAVWQQKQSSSKVSSLVGTYDGNLTSDAALMSQDSVYTQGQDSWDSLALMSIQKELSEFSSVYHQSIKGSSYSQTGDHSHSSGVGAAPQLPPDAESSAASPAFSKSGGKCGGGGGLKVPGSRNFFLHSEFSPFQTWKEYNRLLYDREALPQVLAADQSPRWYDSPFYKELTGAHRAQMAQLEEQRSHRKPHDSPLPVEPPAPTVRQKVSAIEKRSESELMVNCPPWKRSQEPVKNKFPQNRPCTASPSSDKSRRKEEGSVSTGRLSATNYKVQTVADDQTSNSGTPFSICQLLTPTILPRQGTETSEILQYALSPNILSPALSETDPRQTPEIKPRNKYKAMASSLLFNLKDNRKRVKSTYTPTMFKSAEIADHGRQPSQLDSLVGQSKPVRNETVLPKEQEAAPPLREKGQTRQEILTSKLKAHAEKEIFAIKEKGHAKWDAHATKPKELYTHGNRDGELVPTEHGKKNVVPVNGNRLAHQDPAAVKEPHGRNGASINQEASPSVDHVRGVIPGDGESRLAKPASTTREKEHSRNYIIAKTEKISIRQEELQSIARAKIEAIAVNRTQQPKRANEESGYVPPNSPPGLRRNVEVFTTEADADTARGSEEKNVAEDIRKDAGKPGEALQYYAIINYEPKAEGGERAAASSQSRERTPRTEASGVAHGEVREAALAQSRVDHAKAPIPTPRSDTSSPSLGKAILFKVKDNSLRASPVTKTTRPSFQKTLEDQRLGSSQENLSVVEKADEERNRPRENVDVPVLHNAAATALQAHNIQSVPDFTPTRALQAHNIQSAPEFTTTRAQQAHNIQSAPEFTTTRALQAHNIQSAPEYTTTREPPAHNVVPSAEFMSAREPRTYYRRSRPDGRSSAISTMSEDLESCGTSAMDDRASLYSGDRPESACSDVRPFGKPPSVPPKSERALLRAKKLTTRRIKKAEVKAQGGSPTPPEHKPLRAVASMPSSPTEPLLSRRASLPHPALPQYRVEPGYGPHAPSLMAQPFPLTQRKLLQDPNSGQYFVVDMPVPVKTKMFFDPETGKYVQLSVRQSPERSRSNTSSVELLSPPPYVLYPGFLPVPVSTLPPHRSTSQMSAPATLTGEHEKRSAPRRLEALQRKCSREAESYIEPAYRSHDQPRGKPSNDDERGYTSQRNLNIIPMGELEDFAMESN
ncbi:cardiac-enriched FHL2-interacting protein [Conger conger]|uniref:cardiac-enriched FHL2-interacting protein n=1 Tax=Conger conger TaxID=82655 RepID=UPI002A5A1DF3|nr:cardiac-enriched FHL2-interacting protein [Conger conger]